MSNKNTDKPTTTHTVIGATGAAEVKGNVTAVGSKGPVPPGVSLKVTGVEGKAIVHKDVEAVAVGRPSVSKSTPKNDAADNVQVFGDGNTKVLIVSGTGDGMGVFKRMAVQMKDKLLEIGVRDDDIWLVEPKPGRKKTTWAKLKEAFKEIANEVDKPKFIFYYCGHFFKSQTFRIDKKGKDMYKLPAKELATLLNDVRCKYMLTILDMCYSAGFEMGDESAEDEMDDESHLPFTPDDVPDLWSLMGKEGSMAEDGGSMAGFEKNVQWSSSKANEQSKYKPAGSYFTSAIIDVMNELRNTTNKTIWELNDRVIEKIRSRQQGQTPQVKPATNKDYEDFPEFNF